MSNATKYVRILPSAVGSNYGWQGYIGMLLPIHEDNGGENISVMFTSFASDPIERIHTEPVYVSTEPPKERFSPEKELREIKQWIAENPEEHDKILEFLDSLPDDGFPPVQLIDPTQNDLKAFTKAAMQGLLAGNPEFRYDQVAEYAVEYATATINELKKQQP